MELKEHFKGKIFQQISETADELGLECYVVGGYVRDYYLHRSSTDIDVVVVGSGIEVAEALGREVKGYPFSMRDTPQGRIFTLELKRDHCAAIVRK